MLRLLLINPSNEHKGLGNIKATAWPPLNLPYIAAVTPEHYQIEIIDEGVKPFQFQEADIVGITAFTSSVNRAYQIAQIYKEKGIPTVMGGIHVSMMPEEALLYCDTVVVGEAEGVWQQVLKDFEAGHLQRQYNGSWADLDDLPEPRRDLLQKDHYRWGSLLTSRGCPMNCSFCSVTAFNGRRFRRRPLDAVIQELKRIPQKMIVITDDNIIGYGQKDRDWAYAFFSRIVEEGIKKYFFTNTTILFGEDRELIHVAARAGLKIVFIGIESINPKTLKSYRKEHNLRELSHDRYLKLIHNIRKGGIAVLGAFVVGGDDDDKTVFHPTLEFIKSSGIDVLQMSKPTPLPGTQLWETLHKEGRIFHDKFPEAWDDYRLTRLVFKPKQMSIEEVYQGFTYVRKVFFSPIETFKRTINTLLTTKSLVATLISYKFNTSYRKQFINSDHYKEYNCSGLESRFIP